MVIGQLVSDQLNGWLGFPGGIPARSQDIFFVFPFPNPEI